MENKQLEFLDQAPFSLKNKVVLVTGCGSIAAGWGNGRAIATLCAKQGASIYGVDLNPEAAKVTENAILEFGGTIYTEKRDVTSNQDVQDMINACIEKYGRLDVLINNVGRSEPGDPTTFTEQTWHEQLDINLNSAYLTMKYAIPIMAKNGGGSVVNISSVAGIRYIGKPQVAYSAAKAALMQMTSTTAVIHARDNVRINCVVPGLIHTPLVSKLADKYAQGDYEGFVQTRNAQVPMGRMGSAWDIAYAVLFLASDQSSYITGTQLVVDGGFTCATK